MSKLHKIKRVRVCDEVAEVLKKMPNESRFIRAAIREKLEREKLIAKTKMPF